MCYPSLCKMKAPAVFGSGWALQPPSSECSEMVALEAIWQCMQWNISSQLNHFWVSYVAFSEYERMSGNVAGMTLTPGSTYSCSATANLHLQCLLCNQIDDMLSVALLSSFDVFVVTVRLLGLPLVLSYVFFFSLVFSPSPRLHKPVLLPVFPLSSTYNMFAPKGSWWIRICKWLYPIPP